MRGIREGSGSENGEILLVYYPLRSSPLLSGLNDIMPSFVETDIFAPKFNTKIAHCVAWFSTSDNTYETIEITAGESGSCVIR